MRAADVIVDADIIAGGPFRALAQTRKALKGNPPKIFELEGYNSYNWDTVHHGFVAGSRHILFLSKTESDDVFATLTPAAPRLSVQQEGALLALGDPPFRIPVKPVALEEGLGLLLEAGASGKVPERAMGYLQALWDEGEIESRYLAVALAGALHDPRASELLIDASKDKLLKLRLTAIEALGKVGTPEAIKALQRLLKDDKASVAREAARLLAAVQNAESLPDLLEWARKVALVPVATPGEAKSTDTGRAKAESTALEILALTRRFGSLLEAENLSRPLLEIARSSNETLARDALETLVQLAGPAEVSALLEMADDRGFELRDKAATALERITLKRFSNADEFRAWWTQARNGFGEDTRRDAAEAAARGAARTEDSDERRTLLSVLRMAPGEIALVSAAPLMLKTTSNNYFSAEDLVAWNSTLAAPYLIERLGRDSAGQRRVALDGLVQLCARHPRLNAALWPLIRAGLADPDISIRHDAQSAVGTLLHTDAIGALLDALRARSMYEGQDAGRSLYNLSARTMGLSLYEPAADQLIARKHLRGWWERSRDSFKALNLSAPFPIAPALTGTYRLEALATASDSRVSAAAFGVLYSERDASDPVWARLLSQGRQRDKAHGLVGLVGGDGLLAADLAKRLATGDGAGPPLSRALSLLVLGTMKGATPQHAAPGAAKIVEWLSGPGAGAEIAWRRLGILSLGLTDNDPESLAFLGSVLKVALAAKPPDLDLFGSAEPGEDYQLLRPTLLALCARSDSTPLLMKVLESATEDHVRETAARALSLRRHHPAAAGIARAIEKTDRFSWLDLSRVLEPVLDASDAPLLRGMMDRAEATSRASAAWLLSSHPEWGNDAETRGQMQAGLSDSSSLVRYLIAEALGKRRSATALKKLTDLLNDDDDEVRSAAAEAIGLIGDKEACIAAAEASQTQFRLDARWLRALAIAGDEASTKVLEKLANSNLIIEQRAGLESLSAAKSPAALALLLKTFRSDEAALQTVSAEILEQWGNKAFAAVREDLKSPDKYARARAIHLFSRIKSPVSRAALNAISGNADEDAAIRALAQFALRRLEALSAEFEQ